MIASRKGNANERPDTSRLVGKFQRGNNYWHITPTNKGAMTNKEYLRKSLAGLNISDDDLEVILLKAELKADAEVAVRDCDLATYKRMSVILKGMMQNVSEGGYSISWNIEAVKVYYNALCNELLLENALFARPRVRNRSNIW